MKLFLKDFNFENISYLPKKGDYETFERNNQAIVLNVYGLDNKREEVYYHFKSKHIGKRKNRILLLLLKNNHYAYVKKPQILRNYIID